MLRGTTGLLLRYAASGELESLQKNIVDAPY